MEDDKFNIRVTYPTYLGHRTCLTPNSYARIVLMMQQPKRDLGHLIVKGQ
jgi:hypothetical protein